MALSYFQSLLERYQIFIYFAAVLGAIVISSIFPQVTSLENAINPAIAFMLFVTFLQIPLNQLFRSFLQIRFLCALTIANFIAIPCLVWSLLQFTSLETMVKFGLLLVLLAPCIDYVVTFSHMGKADASLLLAFTPFLLLAQMALLPLYLKFFLGSSITHLISPAPFIHALIYLILLPLIFAAIIQFWAKKKQSGESVQNILSLLAVPATSLVLFIVVAALFLHIGKAIETVKTVLPLYIAFAIFAPIIGYFIGYMMKLSQTARRSVAFSSATRNSLIVLPLVLAVPDAIPILPAIIITQTLIELISELFYVRIIAKV